MDNKWLDDAGMAGGLSYIKLVSCCCLYNNHFITTEQKVAKLV